MPNSKKIIQIDDDWLSVFVRQWIACGNPCPLVLRKPSSEGYTAILADINNAKAEKMIKRSKEYITNIRIYDYE